MTATLHPGTGPGAGAAPPAVTADPDGDRLRIDVRLVGAPTAGIFPPAAARTVPTEGEIVEAGGVLGHVDGPGRTEAVASFCTGFLVRYLALDGERVRPGQPLAWLHPVDRPTTRPADGGPRHGGVRASATGSGPLP